MNTLSQSLRSTMSNFKLLFNVCTWVTWESLVCAMRVAISQRLAFPSLRSNTRPCCHLEVYPTIVSKLSFRLSTIFEVSLTILLVCRMYPSMFSVCHVKTWIASKRTLFAHYSRQVCLMWSTVSNGFKFKGFESHLDALIQRCSYEFKFFWN